MTDQPKETKATDGHYLSEAKKEYNNISPLDPSFNFENAVVASLISISEELRTNNNKLAELNEKLAMITKSIKDDDTRGSIVDYLCDIKTNIGNID